MSNLKGERKLRKLKGGSISESKEQLTVYIGAEKSNVKTTEHGLWDV